MTKINNWFLSLFLIVVCSALGFAQFDVKDFGAKGDGTTLDTHAIQKAIDKAYEEGGGVVNVRPGKYKIGSLFLKDNIELHLQAGSRLLGSPDIKDYKVAGQKYESRTRDLYARYFMIFAEGASNISITGSGVIDGNGLNNFQNTRPQNMRPFMIRLTECSNVVIRDVNLLEAANWTLHLLGCKDVKVDGVVIRNHGEGNRDGLDIDACQNVTVSNCIISTTDDAIVLKASNNSICQGVSITNCILSSNGSAIKTGTESNGGFKNIVVSNCVIKDIPVHAGIELMTVDGGMMRNILLENIAMENVATPIFIRLGLRARPFKPGQYVKEINDVQDIFLNNVSVTNAKLPSSIMGIHSKKIKNVTVQNYSVRYTETQSAVPYNKVQFEEFAYPMAIMFSDLPAYGIYCRNVEGLNLQNVKMYSTLDEKRPALAFDRIQDLELSWVAAEIKDRNTALAHFRNTTNVSASFCRTLNENNAMFELERSVANVHFKDNFLRKGQVEIKEVAPLPDAGIYEELAAETKLTVPVSHVVNGLPACDLNAPLEVTTQVTKRGSLQLCVLVFNNSSSPEKLFVRYNGITQEFLVDWNEWGWAPISLLQTYAQGRELKFEVFSENKNSNLIISKVYLRYHDIGFTD